MEQLTNADYEVSILTGAVNALKRHVQEVNDLNVFPIPDGDTGDNMLLTIQGGQKALFGQQGSFQDRMKTFSKGLLLSARGNSGVILSQFFSGIANSLCESNSTELSSIKKSFHCGVQTAYAAVMQPTEGTILTVAREATDYACQSASGDTLEFLNAFLDEAGRSLTRTPDLLPVLKKAGVVDSGGQGLIYIMEGIRDVLAGESLDPVEPQETSSKKAELNYDNFTETSELVYGYCTEVLVRLQSSKTDIEHFDISHVKFYLETLGNSVVTFKTGSILKIHVHTKTPQDVLSFCQKFGEFLTVKIENMSLQHNSLTGGAASEDPAPEPKERKKFATVAVCSGEGIQQAFREMGADDIINGGQSMNPSSQDFIDSFTRVQADTIFVLPNNSNVILAAKQAAEIYTDSQVIVIPSKTIGDGYAALSMLDTEGKDAKTIEEELTNSMEDVITCSVSKCSRNTEMNGFQLSEGQYIGFTGKDVLSADNDRLDTARMLVDHIPFGDHEVCILIRGMDSTEQEADELQSYIQKNHSNVEIYPIDGKQDIYSYILILE